MTRIVNRRLLGGLAKGLAAAAVATGVVLSAHASPSEVSIVQQNYPAGSLARGEQGVVHFAVDLDVDAKIQSCVVTKSSGYVLLDDATCDLIVMHAKFSPAVSGGKRVATTRTGKINWQLPDAYKANHRLAPPREAFTPGALEAKRIICRRHAMAGSLTRTRTLCLTRAEWTVAESEAQEKVDQMINPASTPHGCTGRPGC